MAAAPAPSSLHHTPGMGYVKHMPAARGGGDGGGVQSCACRTRCGDVELKITLTAKFLARPLRDALVEPFLKAHNKRSPSQVQWDDVKCIRVDGTTLDQIDDILAGAVFNVEEATVLLVTQVPDSPLDSLLEAARGSDPRAAAPPRVTRELLRIAEYAADAAVDGTLEADVVRRSATAFETIGSGAAAVTSAAVRRALLRDESVRALCFPEASPHVPCLDGALNRMAVDVRASTCELRHFVPLFAALSAAACAPESAATEETDEAQKSKSRGVRLGAESGSLLESILNDDKVDARRIH